MAKTKSELTELLNKITGKKYSEHEFDTAGYIIDEINKHIDSGGGSSLPDVTTDDNGKVLTVVNGDWKKAEAAKELPKVTTADNKKVLMVVSGEWVKNILPTELPTVTNDDNGKVLEVSSGKWAKVSKNEIDYLATYDAETGQYTVTTTKNFGHAVNCVQYGGRCFIQLVNDNNRLEFLSTSTGTFYSEDENGGFFLVIQFTGICYLNSQLKLFVLEHRLDGITSTAETISFRVI